MFKMGGSTGAGITSGLSRRGYKEAGSVDWGEVDVISETGERVDRVLDERVY